MSDLLRRLEGKPKILRSRTFPSSNSLAIRNSVKGVVDLGGGESFGVKRKHLRRWELLRVESSSPFGILESGSAHPRNHSKRIQETGDRIQELRTSLTDPERILDPSAGFSEQVSHGGGLTVWLADLGSIGTRVSLCGQVLRTTELTVAAPRRRSHFHFLRDLRTRPSPIRSKDHNEGRDHFRRWLRTMRNTKAVRIQNLWDQRHIQ